jgi:hypothetical protein
MREKDDKVIAKISKAEKQELLDFANELDVPYSQLVREGVRLKIAENAGRSSNLPTRRLLRKRGNDGPMRIRSGGRRIPQSRHIDLLRSVQHTRTRHVGIVKSGRMVVR